MFEPKVRGSHNICRVENNGRAKTGPVISTSLCLRLRNARYYELGESVAVS